MTQTKAFLQAHTMLVEHRFDLLFESHSLLHHRLVGAEDLPALSRLCVRLPHHRGKRAQVNARDLDRIHSISRTIGFAHLPARWLSRITTLRLSARSRSATQK